MVKKVSFDELRRMMVEVLQSIGMEEKNIDIVVDIFAEKTKRGVGHHDINDFISHVERARAGVSNANPKYTKIAQFECMESWDGDGGMGELTATFAMDRAIEKAQKHGMGLCTIRNSNHYLASSPYTSQAAKAGCIGMIIAKDMPSMGVPGYTGMVIGQSPNGFAFSTNEDWPVMYDGCFAYVSGHGKLHQYAEAGKPIPEWWGVNKAGRPTTDPTELLMGGTRYPIGEHKGFSHSLLCEVLTGVLSDGPVLDQMDADGMKTTTVHTAIAIKSDGLMSMDRFNDRSSDLIRRLDARAPGIPIPGKRSHEAKLEYEKTNEIEISDELVEYYNIRTGKTKPESLFNEDTLIAFLIRNKSAKAIIEKNFPGFLGSDRATLIQGFPIKMMAAMSQMKDEDKAAFYKEIRMIKE